MSDYVEVRAVLVLTPLEKGDGHYTTNPFIVFKREEEELARRKIARTKTKYWRQLAVDLVRDGVLDDLQSN